MPNIEDSLQPYYFGDTSFTLLMQKRIRKVLVICSNYDFFMLEEDGRIDEQVFNEYVSLKLRYPPVFVHANSAKKAFEILAGEKIDLVIEMLSISDENSFQLAKKIKSFHPDIPIVVLTHFSREVSLRLENEDLSAIDHVFCWLGNSDLLLAIIKLIEDSMNAENDILEIGVQAILLIEDSIRYISIYLPGLYKIILEQSKEFASEALNEHQFMLRRRGRPKILLAKNQKEAISLYTKYKENILGVISDVSYKNTSTSRDTENKAGLHFCRMVKTYDPNLPVLLQSSDLTNKVSADNLGAGFLNKYAKNLGDELKDYILKNFGFGEFIFLDPVTGSEYCKVSDLKSLQEKIMTIPDRVLEFHARKDDLSQWLNARALFPIAKRLKRWKFDDFVSPDEVRKFIYEAIANFRISKGRGVIAEFNKEKFDDYLFFSRIGKGGLGGKARGLAFMDMTLKNSRFPGKYKDVNICVPPSVVLCNDIFEEYIQENNLSRFGISSFSDEEILLHFLKAQLPKDTMENIYSLARIIKNPVAVRSSSKLEDSFYQPFAGVYNTYMISPHANPDIMAEMLVQAVKCVYASVYFKNSKLYMAASSNLIDEEKMGVIIQPVCGTNYNGRFYPTLSGVARSLNYYPTGTEKTTDGIVNLAYGLGKYIADGGPNLRFSPRYPQKIIQLSSPSQALTNTQKYFYALNMDPECFHPSLDDTVNLLKIPIKEAEGDLSFGFAASTFDLENQVINDGIVHEGKRIITFSPVLNHNIFPLAAIVNDLLEICSEALNNPVEIEFAANLDSNGNKPKLFNLLQVRPIVGNDAKTNIKTVSIAREKMLIYSERALGNGSINGICDLVYVKTDNYDPANNRQIAREMEKINRDFIEKNKYYILIGPGRWGSADPWLGIPVKWAQISNARLIVESGLEKYHVDPSQGTHFFHNLTSFGIGYFTVTPSIEEGFVDTEYLKACPAQFKNEFIRHISFSKPLEILIDGVNAKGFVGKS
jgi:hypothetical protein